MSTETYSPISTKAVLKYIQMLTNLILENKHTSHKYAYTVFNKADRSLFSIIEKNKQKKTIYFFYQSVLLSTQKMAFQDFEWCR